MRSRRPSTVSALPSNAHSRGCPPAKCAIVCIRARDSLSDRRLESSLLFASRASVVSISRASSGEKGGSRLVSKKLKKGASCDERLRSSLVVLAIIKMPDSVCRRFRNFCCPESPRASRIWSRFSARTKIGPSLRLVCRIDASSSDSSIFCADKSGATRSRIAVRSRL